MQITVTKISKGEDAYLLRSDGRTSFEGAFNRVLEEMETQLVLDQRRLRLLSRGLESLMDKLTIPRAYVGRVEAEGGANMGNDVWIMLHGVTADDIANLYRLLQSGNQAPGFEIDITKRRT